MAVVSSGRDRYREETLQAMTFSYPVRNYIQQEQEANAVVQFLLSKENLSKCLDNC